MVGMARVVKRCVVLMPEVRGRERESRVAASHRAKAHQAGGMGM